MTAYKGRIVSGGRLQIPADVRRALGVSDGDAVRLEMVDGELRVRSYHSIVRAVQEDIRLYVPDEFSIVDELIADRRAEAQRE